MNGKNICKSLNSKLNKWIDSIDSEEIKTLIKRDAIITGGSIVSLLNGEEPNDYDVYFKTYASCLEVSRYYAEKWNETHYTKVSVIEDTELFDALRAQDYFSVIDEQKVLTGEKADDMNKILSTDGRKKRISMFIRSKGTVNDEKDEVDDNTQESNNPIDNGGEPVQLAEDEISEKPKYRPKYFSSNAVSLSDKIQIVIRFYGSVDEIHENYDFVHCTCSYDFSENKLNLPSRALEAIINKELYYTGSRYPLCSIIRARKFIERGWHINAGQYLKMCLQLNDLDLHDFNVFKDQLTGVDSAYFNGAISAMQEMQEKNKDFKPDNTYLFEVINKIF